MINDNEVQLLITLGFSSSQAKVYLTLTKAGSSTGNSIAKAANVDRAEAYRQLAKLQEKGFVKKILGFPAKFAAIPASELTQVLLQRKKEELLVIESESKKLFQSTFHAETEEKNDQEFIVIVPKLGIIEKELNKRILSIETSIDILSSMKYSNETGVKYIYYWKRVLEKGVKLRFLIEKPQEKNAAITSLEGLKRYPNFRIRYLPSTYKIDMVIEDSDKVWIKTSDKKRAETAWLFSNNSFIVKLAQHYFEILFKDLSK